MKAPRLVLTLDALALFDGMAPHMVAVAVASAHMARYERLPTDRGMQRLLTPVQYRAWKRWQRQAEVTK